MGNCFYGNFLYCISVGDSRTPTGIHRKGAMTRQGLVVGLVFAIVFYLIAAVTRRVRERREYEEAMRKYIEKRMNDDVQV